jgi:glycosyltransferase involved in cell wall biosynthesis
VTLVSIIIPTFNSALYLPDAIQSCLHQTHKDIQIIVVDDGSTDNTREIAAHYPITYLYQANQGAAVARNNGWRIAAGEYLQFLDADDLLLPRKLEDSLRVFAPNIDVVYTSYEYRSVDLTNRLPTPYTLTPQGNVLDSLLSLTRSPFPPHAALIRRSIAERTRKFNEKISITEDWYFWIELASQGVIFHYLDEVLVWYRITPGSLSKDSLKMAQARLKAAEALNELPLPESFNLSHLLAERHHVLALRFWADGQRFAARQHFQKSIQLSPTLYRRHVVQTYLIFMTYFSGIRIAESLLDSIVRIFNRT